MNISEPGAHPDHVLRQSRIHHVQLRTMADVKANAMLTLASLVITFSICYLTAPVLRMADTDFRFSFWDGCKPVSLPGS